MQHKTQQLLNHYFLSSANKNNRRLVNVNSVNCSMPTLKSANKVSPQKMQKLYTKFIEEESLFNNKSATCNKSSKLQISIRQSNDSFSNARSQKKISGPSEIKPIEYNQVKTTKFSTSEKNLGVLKLDKKASEEYYQRRNREIQEINKKLMYCKDFLSNRLPSPRNPQLQKPHSPTLGSHIINTSIKNSNKKNSKQLQKGREYISSQTPSKQHFKIINKLGKGKFGEVCLVIHKKTGFMAAMKILRKSFLVSSMMIKQLIHEIKIQSFIDHPNIIKLYCFFDDEENIYLLSQYLSGGHLYSYLQANPKLSERQVGRLMINICSAVQQMHKNHIIHRDLKPQNMILQNGIVKICDFGWSVHNNQTSMRQTCCGTPLYLSPQILMGSPYNQKTDVWALGIIAYELITKKLPFDIKKQSDLVNITKKRVTFSPIVSQQAKQFISLMLIKNPNQRASLEELLNSTFIKMSYNSQQSTLI